MSTLHIVDMERRLGVSCTHSHDSHANCIERVPIFANLSRNERLEIMKIASLRSFKKNQLVYRTGDFISTLFLVHSGRVKLFRLNANGKEQVLRVVGPGDFMGELSLFSSLPLTDNAQALEVTTMCVLEGQRLKKIMIQYPSIALQVIDELSRRLEKAENLIAAISLSSSGKRLVGALLGLAPDRNEVLLPMPKGDLASQ